HLRSRGGAQRRPGGRDGGRGPARGRRSPSQALPGVLRRPHRETPVVNAAGAGPNAAKPCCVPAPRQCHRGTPPNPRWASRSQGGPQGRPPAREARRWRGAVNEFLQFTLGGVSFGMVYAAIGLSLVLIWRGTRILNYSQGAMAMLTTYIALTVITRTGSYWVG